MIDGILHDEDEAIAVLMMTGAIAGICLLLILPPRTPVSTILEKIVDHIGGVTLRILRGAYGTRHYRHRGKLVMSL